MSILYFLFLSLLCLSCHAFHARHLALHPHDHNKSAKKLQVLNKNIDADMVINNVRDDSSLIEVKSSTTNPLGESTKRERLVSEMALKDHNGRISERRLKDGRKVSAASRARIRTAVSWRVPHKKLDGGKNPGFNLDYAPPKTHPPSHN